MMRNKNTFETEWSAWRQAHQSLNPEIQWRVRAGASYRLGQHMAGSGCGIGSSDINHAMFQLWKDHGKDTKAYMYAALDLYGERIQDRLAEAGV